jgi:hypothetical protein
LRKSRLLQVVIRRLAASCYPQACCKLFKQFSASLWITSLQIPDSRFHVLQLTINGQPRLQEATEMLGFEHPFGFDNFILTKTKQFEYFTKYRCFMLEYFARFRFTANRKLRRAGGNSKSILSIGFTRILRYALKHLAFVFINW